MTRFKHCKVRTKIDNTRNKNEMRKAKMKEEKERKTKKNKKILLYRILCIRYTHFSPFRPSVPRETFKKYDESVFYFVFILQMLRHPPIAYSRNERKRRGRMLVYV